MLYFWFLRWFAIVCNVEFNEGLCHFGFTDDHIIQIVLIEIKKGSHANIIYVQQLYRWFDLEKDWSLKLNHEMCESVSIQITETVLTIRYYNRDSIYVILNEFINLPFAFCIWFQCHIINMMSLL